MTRSPTLPTPRQLIPDPDVAEFHRRRLDVAPDVAARAAREITCGEVRLLGPLMALRALPVRLTRAAPGAWPPGTTRLFDQFAQGFDLLAVEPDGYLFAQVGQPFRLMPGGGRRTFASIEEFVAFDEPGYCRIVGDLRITVEHGVTFVSTETIVDCTDPATRRAFTRYWRLIGPFSALIRRSMLAAVRRRASHPDPSR